MDVLTIAMYNVKKMRHGLHRFKLNSHLKNNNMNLTGYLINIAKIKSHLSLDVKIEIINTNNSFF